MGATTGRHHTGSIATVLVVEDECVIAEDLTELLEELGYKVAGHARFAKDAIAMLQAQRVDIVLMDIILNGKVEGIGATVEIEALGVPVVYLSGCTMPDTEPSVIGSQPFGFVPKPYDSLYLARVLERVRQGTGSMAGEYQVH